MKKVKSETAELAKKHTLEELRFRRDMAARDGDLKLAVKLATAIDKKRGFYK